MKSVALVLLDPSHSILGMRAMLKTQLYQTLREREKGTYAA